MARRFRLAAAVALTSLAVGCGRKPSALAELQRADGPVERQQGEAAWQPAAVGTKYYLGDAARTADGPAQLVILGGAELAMQPHTILRFGGHAGHGQISVELGAIELSGTGNYGFDLGEVRLSSGRVRVTAKGNGQSVVELTMGDAQVSTLGGQTFELELGQGVSLAMGAIQVVPIDAGVPVDAPAVADAPVDAPIDAPAVAIDGATLEIDGKKAEVLGPGETRWAPVPPGATTLARGATLRLGRGTRARLTAQGTTLDLAGGSRVRLGEELSLFLEGGVAQAAVEKQGSGTLAVPGGTITVSGTARAGAEAKVELNAREARVRALRGSAKLTGANGGELELNRGESATIAKGGTIRVLEAIPTYHDFRLAVGETVTIHDPKGLTAVRFDFGDRCVDGGFIEMDRNTHYRTAKVSAGKDGANMAVRAGSWAYRLRCSTDAGDSAPVGSGRIVVRRDAGTRKLPKDPATIPIDADGRPYRLSYQSVMPTLLVRTKGKGARFRLHLASGGKDVTFDATAPSVSVPGTTLQEGSYTYWFERDGVKDPKVSTLIIDFDNTAAQVYIELPVDGRPWSEDIKVRGAVLPGWTASIDGVTLPMDKQRRFTATVQRPSGNALAIKLSHPQRGVHYYLRRAGT